MSLQRESFSVCIACHSVYPAEMRECQRKGCFDGEGGVERLWLVTPYPPLPGYRKWWPPEMRQCAPTKWQRADRDDELTLLGERINAMRGALIEMLRQGLLHRELEPARADLRALLSRQDTLRAQLAAVQETPALQVQRDVRRVPKHFGLTTNGNSHTAAAGAIPD